MDHEDGYPDNRNYLKYDMAISGPALGIVSTF
jgi:hypothetical protein